MKQDVIVRLMKTELYNFKNVQFGEVKYMNYGSLNKDASFSCADIIGLYGQNGSGKTALVEGLDALKFILAGQSLPYKSFLGLVDDQGNTKIVSIFFVSVDEKQYKVQYEAMLKADQVAEKINIVREKIVYWEKGSSWKAKRDLCFANPYYENDNILGQENLSIESMHIGLFKNIPFLGAMQTLAAVSAAEHRSVFFNSRVRKALNEIKENAGIESQNLSSIIESLTRFAAVDFHVIKVNQLGDINGNECIPINMRYETKTEVMQGCLPLFINGQGELPRVVFDLFAKTIDAINIAIKSVIPNLQIDLEIKSNLKKPDGQEVVQVEVYSNRDGKRFLIQYESEGIKRIISLLHFLISVYNNPSTCLVVDELDSGIFEYLLGELLGVMQQDMKGQLIFTSHNLRALEKLEAKNIICSTTNPNNRYIRLTGINRNNNRRDFYIRSIAIGGQQEELYNDDDLQAMGYAFRKAGKKSENEIQLSSFSEKMLNRIKIFSESPEKVRGDK